jgi:hypothetical protein
VNFGTPVPLLIGIVLILGAVALFFLDSLKPGYGRGSDKVYAILWLISGVFLLGHLTMELLASFQQLLMAGMLIAVTIENVLSRTPQDNKYAAQPAGGDSRSRNDYYRPSRSPAPYSGGARMNVRAELDEEPSGNRLPTDRRMLRSRDSRDDRAGNYRDDYPARYPDDRSDYGYPNRTDADFDRSQEKLPPGNDRIRRRRPKSYDSRYDAPYSGSSIDDWSSNSGGNTYSGSSTYSPHSVPNQTGSGYSSHSPTPPNTAYPTERAHQDDSYVDYRPVNYPTDDASSPASDYDNRY